ncbi:MAG: hypothetical protein IPM46_09665 [Flavobacteriales bacterium]|nr:hypothetical protein [Flavobacteriales bacterium]
MRLFSVAWLGQYLQWTDLMGATILTVRLQRPVRVQRPSYLAGRYSHPRQELRIFVFLDMARAPASRRTSSHVRYFQLIDGLFREIADPIVYSRGEIRQYVGDEMGVSWPLRRGVNKQRCIRCFLDIRAKLKSRASHYQARYGISARFQGRLPLRQVTTGEVGLVKKERIFSGDAVNTAARIQNTCNAHGVDNLITKGCWTSCSRRGASSAGDAAASR